MAKKKTTENIKAAPVLRAISDSDQPTPKPEQTGTRTYQIMDPWKDRGVTNLVDVKAVDGEITDIKVNGEPAGGGGGDFSTAQVTIDNSNNQGGYPEIYGSIIDSYNTGGMPPTLADCTGGEIAPFDPIQTYTIILYKGKAKLFVNDSAGSHTITVSGNVTDNGSTTYIVSGNGTITIS